MRAAAADAAAVAANVAAAAARDRKANDAAAEQARPGVISLIARSVPVQSTDSTNRLLPRIIRLFALLVYQYTFASSPVYVASDCLLIVYQPCLQTAGLRHSASGRYARRWTARR